MKTTEEWWKEKINTIVIVKHFLWNSMHTLIFILFSMFLFEYFDVFKHRPHHICTKSQHSKNQQPAILLSSIQFKSIELTFNNKFFIFVSGVCAFSFDSFFWNWTHLISVSRRKRKQLSPFNVCMKCSTCESVMCVWFVFALSISHFDLFISFFSVFFFVIKIYLGR